MKLWGLFGPTQAKPIVGKNVNMSGVPTVFIDCQHQVTIEDDCFFGHGVKILTGSHDYTKFGVERQRAIITKPVTIKTGVWVASYVVILPGVTIGEHAVVGAGSVVTKDVPAYELWCGNPATFKKKLK